MEPIPVPSLYDPDDRQQIKESVSKLQDVTAKEMQQKLNSHQINIKVTKITLEAKVVVGIPEEEIVRFVNDYKVDVVVMAKRRKIAGFRRYLQLGSTSRKLLEVISCPIFLIDGEK